MKLISVIAPLFITGFATAAPKGEEAKESTSANRYADAAPPVKTTDTASTQVGTYQTTQTSTAQTETEDCTETEDGTRTTQVGTYQSTKTSTAQTETIEEDGTSTTKVGTYQSTETAFTDYDVGKSATTDIYASYGPDDYVSVSNGNSLFSNFMFLLVCLV